MAIEKVKIANLVVEDFEKRIRTGELKKGDKLPNENQLAKMLNISRLSLREGLQLLRTMGAISQRPKVGTVVICDNPDLWVRIPTIQEGLDENMLGQLNDARVLLETYMVRLYAQNASYSSLQSLKAKLNEQTALASHLEDDDAFEHFVDCDMDFHLIIANGSGNTYLAKVFSSVLQNIRDFAVSTFRNHLESPSHAVDMHRKIYEAVASKNGELSAELMRQHIIEATNVNIQK